MLTTTTYRSPWMNDELALLRETAREFFRRESVPHQARWAEQQHVDREFWHKAGEVGLLCASIPEEYGGAGGSFAHDAVILDAQGHAGDTAFGNGVHSAICAHYILNYADEQQKQRWLPKMATGEMVAAIAMTEPGTGSDLQAIKTRARRDGDEYVIDGAKTFISNGLLCDLLIIVCRTGGEGAGGVSLIVAETDDRLPGFTRGRLLEKIGQHGQDTIELFFDALRVPVANLLGDGEGLGFAQLMNQLPRERLSIAVTAVAVMEAALQQTIAYTRERSAFRRQLLDFQNTRFVLAERKTEATIARIFLDECIQRELRGELDAATAAMAKWWLTQKEFELVDDCLQLHGGYGYMTEYPISRAFVDSRVARIYGGANEIMKEIIGRTLDGAEAGR
jgi:long-chain-acyl-CoA dehydrogenase